MSEIFIFKDRLKKAMQIRGMNETALSDRSGMQKSSISRYLAGENIPRKLALMKLSDALHVNPAWLLGFDAPMETGVDNIRIDIEKLTEENRVRLEAYYKELLEEQEV